MIYSKPLPRFDGVHCDRIQTAGPLAVPIDDISRHHGFVYGAFRELPPSIGS